MDAQWYQAASFWFSVASFLFTGVVGLYVYVTSRQRATREQIDAFDEKHATNHNLLSQRVSSLEADMKHTPTHDDLSDIYESINKTNKGLANATAEIAKVSGELKPLSAQLSTILNYLMESKK